MRPMREVLMYVVVAVVVVVVVIYCTLILMLCIQLVLSAYQLSLYLFLRYGVCKSRALP
jgi:hypothetical protein